MPILSLYHYSSLQGFWPRLGWDLNRRFATMSADTEFPFGLLGSSNDVMTITTWITYSDVLCFRYSMRLEAHSAKLKVFQPKSLMKTGRTLSEKSIFSPLRDGCSTYYVRNIWWFFLWHAWDASGVERKSLIATRVYFTGGKDCQSLPWNLD